MDVERPAAEGLDGRRAEHARNPARHAAHAALEQRDQRCIEGLARRCSRGSDTTAGMPCARDVDAPPTRGRRP
jgi:hypothetical protein